jgi:DNA-binding MarR family transcriptional regulator
MAHWPLGFDEDQMPRVPCSSDRLVEVLRHVVAGLIRDDRPILTAIELAIFLVCYLESGRHTVPSLAIRLDVSKPAISSALDRLGVLGLAQRAREPDDGRIVTVRRTEQGQQLLSDIRGLVVDATCGVGFGNDAH